MCLYEIQLAGGGEFIHLKFGGRCWDVWWWDSAWEWWRGQCGRILAPRTLYSILVYSPCQEVLIHLVLVFYGVHKALVFPLYTHNLHSLDSVLTATMLFEAIRGLYHHHGYIHLNSLIPTTPVTSSSLTPYTGEGMWRKQLNISCW